ncbi:hypothetical protein H7X46_19235 [Pseudonocardia sp. C8]|uniref:hypothetical protein n=1 Tax=Pseudonocardia sp. C8 TaxID=2762759 RepID=UPI00164266BE|nr:hypothetical protein [Pseudonocardia sp. C8]MBC3193197.1 hypothetical protein [Pseudonocardia sp. C8]
MTAPSLRPAELDDTALAKVKQLEDRIGKPLVAYRAESPYADLTEEQLAEVRRAESELGVQLLAFRP